MKDITSDWRHIDKKDMKDVLSGSADESTKKWFNYHLGEDGHNCKLCKDRLNKLKKPE